MGKNRTGTFAHVFLHVSSVEKSAWFYDLVLRQLGWVRTVRDPEWAAWAHEDQAFFIVIFEDPDRIKVEVAYIPTERHVDH